MNDKKPPFGFFGRLLRIDLSKKTSRVEEFTEADARKYYLDSGLAAKMLCYDFPNDMHPLAPSKFQ